MATSIIESNIDPRSKVVQIIESITAPTTATPGGNSRLYGQVAVQISGPATAVDGVIERSIDGTNWAPIDTVGIQGNPSTGINVAYVIEPAAAFYRWRGKTMTGASYVVQISGKAF